MISSLFWLFTVLFVALWVVLWLSTFGHLTYIRGHPSQHPIGIQAQTPSLALKARLADLQEHVHVSETALEHLLEAATERQRLVAIQSKSFVAPLPPPLASKVHRPKPSDISSHEGFDSTHELRGFKDHQMLALNETAFRTAPLDMLMAQYGTAHGGGSCDYDFGMGLINRWRKAGESCCRGRSDTSSSLKCHHIRQTRHHGTGDQLCVGQNVRVDLAPFADPRTTDGVMAKYISSKHMDQAYIHYKKSTLAATCDLNFSLWTADAFPGWNQDWQKSLEILPGRSDSDLGCDVWETRPTLLVQRDTFANMFHNSEDFFNAFIALAILRWNTADLQVIVADLYPKGPFWDMWSKVFSNVGRQKPLTAWDLKTKYGAKKVCFKVMNEITNLFLLAHLYDRPNISSRKDDLALGIYGPASPITVASWRTPCSRTPLVRAYADYVIRGLSLHHLTHYAQPTPPRTITITYMARRASSQWPERRFCDSVGSFFRCEDWQHLDKRSLGRMIRNDDAVVASLKALEQRKWRNGATVKFRDVDFNNLNFEEQIEVDVTTDVMVGPHGAGLMHNIFMPDRGVLVELHIDNSAANQHFHNLARWQGRQYMTQTMRNPVDVNSLTNLVAKAVESVDIRTY